MTIQSDIQQLLEPRRAPEDPPTRKYGTWRKRAKLAEAALAAAGITLRSEEEISLRTCCK